VVSCFFFFQAEDGIRDFHVTGVQTCALPILRDAAEQAGVTAGEARLAFPGGVLDLVDYFLADGDRRMTEALAHEDLASMKIRERSEERRVGKECRSWWTA